VDDVMFSDNEANGAELKTTLCLVAFAKRQHQSEAAPCTPRAKSAILIACLLAPARHHSASTITLPCAGWTSTVIRL